MSQLIAFTGRKGTGKDTCVNYLVDKYGFSRVSFAGLLKDVVAFVYDLPRERLEGLTDEDRAWRERANPLINNHLQCWEGKYEKVLAMVYPSAFTFPSRDTWSGLAHACLGYKTPAEVLYLLKQKVSSLEGTWSPREALQIIGTDVHRSIYEHAWVEGLFHNLPQRACISDLRFMNEATAVQDRGGLLIYLERPNQQADSCFTDHASEQVEVLRELANVGLSNEGTIADLHASLDLVLQPLIQVDTLIDRAVAA